jgi:hypothetical protein
MDFEKLKTFAQTYTLFSLATTAAIMAIAGKPVASQALVGITICYGWLVLPPTRVIGGSSRIAYHVFNGMMVAAFVVSIACVLVGLLYGL